MKLCYSYAVILFSGYLYKTLVYYIMQSNDASCTINLLYTMGNKQMQCRGISLIF